MKAIKITAIAIGLSILGTGAAMAAPAPAQSSVTVMSSISQAYALGSQVAHIAQQHPNWMNGNTNGVTAYNNLYNHDRSALNKFGLSEFGAMNLNGAMEQAFQQGFLNSSSKTTPFK